MILVVGAAIVDDLDRPTRLLAARRHRPPALAGRWEFPGGKVEPGETPLAALHRELAEELAVTVRVGAELRHPGAPAWPLTEALTLRVWFAVLTSGTPRTGDTHDELRWLPADRLFDVPWLPGDVAVVAALAEILGGHRETPGP